MEQINKAESETSRGNIATETLADGQERKSYTWCFACGKDNPIGLHMQFAYEDDSCISYFTPRHEHQSYDGRMHGGLISVLLDEVMGNYLFNKEGKPAYTAKMELRFRAPIMIGTRIKCVGREMNRKGRLVVMQGQIINPDGKVAAEAVAKMMVEE